MAHDAPGHTPHAGPTDAHDHHDHDHHHDPRHDGHGHGHHHHHGADFSRAYAIGAVLNLAFVIAEAVAGVWSHSLALLSDAGHNLSDVLGLVLSWGAVALARRAATDRRTYGLGKTTILASLANGSLLLIAVGAIVWEAIRRLAAPEAVASQTVVIVAALGLLINGATALMFRRGHNDLNARGAFLHMAADAAVSAGVVVGALVIGLTHWTWIDPAISLVIAAVIVLGAWDLMRSALNLTLDAAPEHIDTRKVRAYLEALPGVAGVHDLHVWALSTTEAALTAHVVRAANDDGDEFLCAAEIGLSERFGIGHATLQIEISGARDCPLAAAHAL